MKYWTKYTFWMFLVPLVVMYDQNQMLLLTTCFCISILLFYYWKSAQHEHVLHIPLVSLCLFTIIFMLLCFSRFMTHSYLTFMINYYFPYLISLYLYNILGNVQVVFAPAWSQLVFLLLLFWQKRSFVNVCHTYCVQVRSSF